VDRSFAYDSGWLKSLDRLEAFEQEKVARAKHLYLTDSTHPGLNLEKLRGVGNRLHTIRASEELRVLLACEGPVTVFLRAGHHDPVYRMAPRVRYVVPRAGDAGLYPVGKASDLDGEPLAAPRGRRGAIANVSEGIVDHWEHRDLRDYGFSDDEIRYLRTVTAEGLGEVAPRWYEVVERAIKITEADPYDWRFQALVERQQAEAERFRAALADSGAVAGLSPWLSPEELDVLLGAPIEDWMIFLHPQQRALVERDHKGASRVRGSAGTGKTVVALHRAARLGRVSQAADAGAVKPVAFVTFIRTLPPLLEGLFKRLCADGNRSVEFWGVDRLANSVYRDSGGTPRIDMAAVDAAFEQAHGELVTKDSLIGRSLRPITADYLRAEIDDVIRGRGIASLEDYLSARRPGRRIPFGAPIRAEVWALHRLWARLREESAAMDFLDVMTRARDIARARSEGRYRAVIVDESQDLQLVALQFLRALVNPGELPDMANEILLVGDSAQKINPGGYSLADAGLDVRGKAAVLRVNYRNTREVIDTAMACTGAQQVDDHGETYERGEQQAETLRGGRRPILVEAAGLTDQIDYVVAEVENLVYAEENPVEPRDIAVLAYNTKTVRTALSALAEHNVEHRPLTSGDVAAPGVRVGTFDRAKGLEFKFVFLLALSAQEFPSFPHRRKNETDDEYAERLDLDISRLFVAMTRARDGLYVLHTAEPSPLLSAGLSRFERVKTPAVLKLRLKSP
jgi:hypothetical protein